MAYSKITVTIPDEVYSEAKAFIAARSMKLSHLVSEAIAEKLRKAKEEEFVKRMNECFSDPDIANEQKAMSEEIVSSIDIEELPW